MKWLTIRLVAEFEVAVDGMYCSAEAVTAAVMNTSLSHGSVLF